MAPPHRCIELLAPARDRECISAAIENGADAVYFGIDTGFNARARATNFPLSSLPETMGQLHLRNVRGYVTLNTLVFTSELLEFEATVRAVADAGVDAVLVQDLGAAKLIREICPDLSIHASTQMSLTSAETIAAVESLGIDRVVLARELSIDEIRRIAKNTTMPLEVFAHGALCVAYSGQCMTSESLGGRSANRGQCAQACRLPYELICDGKDVDLGDQKYLLSPQDLAAFELIPELIDAGVCSLKIEGRLKTPEYVANITRRYREAIDMALAERPVVFDRETIDEMELSFSRGFSPGWLRGCDHKMLVPALSSAKRGVLLGEVDRVGRSSVTIRLNAPRGVHNGDGVVFEGNRASSDEQGGRIYGVRTVRGSDVLIELSFGHGKIEFDRLYVGQQVWKTDDPILTKRLRKSYQANRAVRRTPVAFHVFAATGRPLRIAVTLPDGRDAAVESSAPLEKAKKRPATVEMIRTQLDRLGNTTFELGDVECEVIDSPMIPLSVFGELRKRLIGKLEQHLVDPPPRTVAEPCVVDSTRQKMRLDRTARSTRETTLHVLCRTMEQLRIAVDFGVKSVMADFQDIMDYWAAVAVAREHNVSLLIATPRIQKPGEIGIFRKMAGFEPDGVLVRNLSGIEFFHSAGVPIVADASLNVANELTAAMLLERGVDRVTASFDLNRDQLSDLIAAAPAHWFEVVIHQHMPMFHMEHCVFCAVLSPGTNKTNCGRPCDFHHVKLRDRVGAEHTLLADVGCRNTLFNEKPQSAAEIMPQLQSSGVTDFRIELLDHNDAGEITTIITLYRELLSGNRTGREVWTKLKAANRVGVTRGTLEESRNPLAIL
ncbi:MAG: U32 family peptidase [Planctomycetales bacterium]|nr:U32 family peptidase [Planctomycetales bacterium]